MSKTRRKRESGLLLRTLILAVLVVLTASLLPVGRALAQPWYLPTEGVDSVFLQNNSDQPQTLWLNAPDIQESNISLSPREEKSIDLSAVKNSKWFQIHSYVSLPVSAVARVGAQNISVGSGRSETLKSPWIFSEQQVSLHLVNLSANAQNISLITTAGVQEIRLTAFAQGNYPIHLGVFDQLRIQGQYPLSAYWSDGHPQFLQPSVSEQAFNPDPQEVYFLMSNSSNDQSFVFHSHDAGIVRESRFQLAHPEQRKILVAKIDYGHDNCNRDLINPLRNAWSWHVSEVFEFGSIGSQACDGTPALVEDNLRDWIGNQGSICFWNYKITRELRPEEVAQ